MLALLLALLDAVPLDPEEPELEDDADEFALELEEEFEVDEVGVLMLGAPGSSGVPPQPNRETQRHNNKKYFITALRRDS